MRFSRDRRGYEHTYVVHAFRGHGRQEPRILYWFRTPPHVRVGRAAIDEEAIRLLEDAHPDVPFDWSRMLKAQPPPPPPPEDAMRRRRQKMRPERGRVPAPPRGDRRPAPAPAPVSEPEAEPGIAPEIEPEIQHALAQGPEPALEAELAEAEPTEAIEALDALEPPEAPEPPEPPIHPSFLEPAVLERLRVRYAELLTRISQRIPDPVKRDVLRGEAERLNPETWVTQEEARTGLEHFERWFEAIRAQLPAPPRRHRRGRRRGGRGKPGSEPGPGAGSGEV